MAKTKTNKQKGKKEKHTQKTNKQKQTNDYLYLK